MFAEKSQPVVSSALELNVAQEIKSAARSAWPVVVSSNSRTILRTFNTFLKDLRIIDKTFLALARAYISR